MGLPASLRPFPGETLDSYRIRRGYRHAQDLATAAGFSPAAYCHLARGAEGYPLARERLCKLLGISLRQLSRLVDAGIRAVRT